MTLSNSLLNSALTAIPIPSYFLSTSGHIGISSQLGRGARRLGERIKDSRALLGLDQLYGWDTGQPDRSLRCRRHSVSRLHDGLSQREHHPPPMHLRCLYGRSGRVIALAAARRLCYQSPDKIAASGARSKEADCASTACANCASS